MRTSLAVASCLAACLGLTASHTRAQNAASVSLDSLLEAARRNYPTLSKQALLAQSLELTKSKLNRAYWPQLSLGAQATWQSEVTSLPISVPGVNISPPSKDQYRATLDLRQNIWDGGVTSDQKHVAESRARVEQEKVNVEWYQVRDRILQLYFAGVVQKELASQGESLERHLDAVVEKAKLSQKSGILTQRDVLLAQAKQLEARQASAEATAQLAGVRRSLEDLTGVKLSPDAVLAPRSSTCAPATAHPAPETLRRPELKLLDAQTRLLEAQEQLDRSADYPRLGAFATAGYGRPGLNFLNDSFKSYFVGGVQLTVPLTYLYADTHGNGREQLAVQRSLVARERETAVKQVDLQLDTQTTELNRLGAVIALDDELLRMRQGASQQTEIQLGLGTASMTDLINDLTQEDQARTRGAVHRAQQNLACHQLALIKGDL